MLSGSLCLILLAFYGTSSAEDADCPNIIKRSEWKGRIPKNVTDLKTPVSHVMIHQTVTRPCWSQRLCSMTVRGIQNKDMNLIGLNDIGYSFLIGGDGNVYEGRGWDSVGAHTIRWDERSVAIAFIGYYQVAEPSEIMLDTARKLIACGKSEGKLRDDVKVLGPHQFSAHSQHGPSIGLGDSLDAQVKTWPEWSDNP